MLMPRLAAGLCFTSLALRLQAPTSWLWQYYKYRIRVYCPWTQKIELVEATDPYAKCCAADGRLSQVPSKFL